MSANATDAGDGVLLPDFKFYEPHPYLGMFPTETDDDLLSVKDSVGKIGVVQRLRVWVDAKGREWLIDGRTRQRAASEVWREMVDAEAVKMRQAGSTGLIADPVAENGVPIQPEVEYFTGTLAQVAEFVNTSHVRKHYTSGQKAAYGVKLHYFEHKEAHHGRLPSTASEEDDEGGRSAAALAKRFGANDWYIRICRQLFREAPDLLDSVAMAVTNPKSAFRELQARRLKKADGDTAEDAGENPDEMQEEVKDDAGVTVPDKCRPAFAQRVAFSVAKKQLTKIKQECEKLAGTEGGKFLDFSVLEQQFKAIQRHLEECRPVLVCTKCGGRGKNNRWDCARCKGSGVVCKLVQKAEAEAAKTDAPDTGGAGDGDAGE